MKSRQREIYIWQREDNEETQINNLFIQLLLEGTRSDACGSRELVLVIISISRSKGYCGNNIVEKESFEG